VFLAPNVVQQTADQIATSTTTGDDKLIIQRDYRGAEVAYQRALSLAVTAHDTNAQARLLGRLGNLHRVMAKDLRRPEQTRVAYDYFNKAQAAINKTRDRETHARILADWSLLYSDNGQHNEARSAIESALSMSPNDPFVNVDYAVQLYRSKSYPQMQQYVDKTLFLDPANWQALWYQVKLAELYNDQGRVKSTLKEILRFYPWSKLAAQKLGALQAP
jgi:tetratricopeptide (TPR) repeat protein